jgi:alpha-tubulin suppressor-like RCC1 family protein
MKRAGLAAVVVACASACGSSTSSPPDAGVDGAGNTPDVAGTAKPTVRNDLACAQAVAIAGNPTCVLLRDHTLWCAGGNFDGALGVGVADDFFGTAGGFVQVQTLGSEVASVAIARNRVCAIKRDASLWCWGDNLDDYLGLGTSAPLRTPTRSRALGDQVSQVDFGPFHACARKVDGSIWCWGDAPGSSSVQPAELTAAGRDNVQLAVGAGFTCVRKDDGSAWCWGQNHYGEIGQGIEPSSATPRQLTTLGNEVAEIAAEGNHACATKADGSVWCWGWNRFGEALPGGPTAVRTPTRLTGLTAPIVQLELDSGSSCGRAADGAVFCWGDPFGGVLGGSVVTAASATPATAAGGPAAQVTTDGHGTCVTGTLGAVHCWGRASLVPQDRAAAGKQVIAPCP